MCQYVEVGMKDTVTAFEYLEYHFSSSSHSLTQKKTLPYLQVIITRLFCALDMTACT